MRKTFAVCLVIGGLLMAMLGFSGPAGAQTSDDVTASFDVGDYLSLTLSKTAVSFGTVVPGNSYGSAPETDIVATVKANRTWTLSYTAPSHFSKNGEADTSVAVGCLRWNATAFTTGANFAANQTATPVDGTALTHTYTLVLPEHALDNASYTVDVSYLLAAAS